MTVRFKNLSSAFFTLFFSLILEISIFFFQQLYLSSFNCTTTNLSVLDAIQLKYTTGSVSAAFVAKPPNRHN
jgi:hypothetical protein